MAKSIGTELPQDAFVLLTRGELASQDNRVVQIVTASQEGWPNLALLTYAGVMAKDKTTLHLATWADGECAADLRHNGRLVVLIIGHDMAYYVRGIAEEVTDAGRGLTDVNQQGGESALAFFKARIEEVFEDRVPTARILTGVTFEATENEEQTHREILKRLLSM